MCTRDSLSRSTSGVNTSFFPGSHSRVFRTPRVVGLLEESCPTDTLCHETRQHAPTFTSELTKFGEELSFRSVALVRPDTNARSRHVNARSHLNFPCQKQWLPGMRGKQEPPRRARSSAPTCSHESLVGLFSHAHQSTGRETASLDPTRVPTEGVSRTRKWPFTRRHCEVAHNTWRKTKPTTPFGVGSPSDQYNYSCSHLGSSSGPRRLLDTRATEEQQEMITAEHTRCDGKYPLIE